MVGLRTYQHTLDEGKEIPVQAYTGQEVVAPGISIQSAHKCGKDASLTLRSPLLPQTIHLVLISVTC